MLCTPTLVCKETVVTDRRRRLTERATTDHLRRDASAHLEPETIVLNP